MKKEYIRRVNDENVVFTAKCWYVIKAFSSRAVTLLRYRGRIINWTKSELEALDRNTRKILTIPGTLHPRSNVSGLQLPRREGQRGLIN